MKRVVAGFFAVGLSFSLTTAAGAQSLTSIRGLGYPIAPTDARSEALGGLGIGLIGLSVPMINPASAGGVDRRGIVLAAQATERTTTLGGVSGRTGTTRFPMVRVLFPFRTAVLTAGYGSFLDQSWGVTRQGSQSIGGTEVRYRDEIQSTGGIGQAQLGAAFMLGEQLSVGVTVGQYTGRQDVATRRLFDDTTAAGNIEPFAETRSRRYSGPMAQVGARWDPSNEVRLGASVTWSGTLTADSIGGSVQTREFNLPLQVAAGASAYLAPSLLAAVSGRWSGWSVMDSPGSLAQPGGITPPRDTWEVGVGLELDNPESRSLRTFPLRAGFQYRQLPFTFVSDAPTEWVASVGTGMRVGTDVNTPLARLDLTIQRGARSAAGDANTPALDESMWRFVLALSIFGT